MTTMTTSWTNCEKGDKEVEEEKQDDYDFSTDFQNNVGTLTLFARLSELEEAHAVEHKKEISEEQLRMESLKAISLSSVRELNEYSYKNERLAKKKMKNKAHFTHMDGKAIMLSLDDELDDGWYSDPSDISTFDTVKQKWVDNIMGLELGEGGIGRQDDNNTVGRGGLGCGIGERGGMYHTNNPNGFIYNMDLSTAQFHDEYSTNDINSILANYDDDHVGGDGDMDESETVTFTCKEFDIYQSAPETRRKDEVMLSNEQLAYNVPNHESLNVQLHSDTTRAKTMISSYTDENNAKSEKVQQVPINAEKMMRFNKQQQHQEQLISNDSAHNHVSLDECKQCVDNKSMKMEMMVDCKKHAKNTHINETSSTAKENVRNTLMSESQSNQSFDRSNNCNELYYLENYQNTKYTGNEWNEINKHSTGLQTYNETTIPISNNPDKTITDQLMNIQHKDVRYESFPKFSDDANLRSQHTFNEGQTVAYDRETFNTKLCSDAYFEHCYVDNRELSNLQHKQKIVFSQLEKLKKINQMENILKQIKQKQLEIQIIPKSMSSPRISLGLWNQIDEKKRLSNKCLYDSWRSCETVNMPPHLATEKLTKNIETVDSRKACLTPPFTAHKYSINPLSLTISKSNNELLLGTDKKTMLGDDESMIGFGWMNQCGSISSASICSSEHTNKTCDAQTKILHDEIRQTKCLIRRLENQISQLEQCLYIFDKSADMFSAQLMCEKTRLLDDTRKRFEDLEFSLVELQARFEADAATCAQLTEQKNKKQVTSTHCPYLTPKNNDDPASIQNSDYSSAAKQKPLLDFKRIDKEEKDKSTIKLMQAYKMPSKNDQKKKTRKNVQNINLRSPSDNQNIKNETKFETTNNRSPINNYKVAASNQFKDQTIKQKCNEISQCHTCLQSFRDESPACSYCKSRCHPPTSPYESSIMNGKSNDSYLAKSICKPFVGTISSCKKTNNLIKPMPVDFFADSNYYTKIENKEDAGDTSLFEFSYLNNKSPTRKRIKSTPSSTDVTNNQCKSMNPAVITLSRSCGSNNKCSSIALKDQDVSSQSPASASYRMFLQDKKKVTDAIHASSIQCPNNKSQANEKTEKATLDSQILDQSATFWCSCSSSSMSSSPPSSSSSINARGPMTRLTSHDVSYSSAASSVQHRTLNRKKQDRPLTRYLPVASNAKDFDLRQHIENAGHIIDPIESSIAPSIELTDTCCRGYLMKMGQKFRTWHKRWFVFDRTQRTFSYYKHPWSEQKSPAKGCIFFKHICEVYVDHLNAVRSPSSKSTFVVKTSNRSYYLAAPSSEDMRVWVDVLITGAEGHYDYKTQGDPDGVDDDYVYQ